MKAIRYVIFFQFLLVVGLLAVAYAAPDAFLLTVSAAESTEADCGSGECQSTSTQTETLAAQVVHQPALGDGQGIEYAEENGRPHADPAQVAAVKEAPVQAIDSPQNEAESLRDRQIAIPAGKVTENVASLGVPDGVGEAKRFDPGLADEAAAIGLDLQEKLRIDAELGAFVQQVSTGHSGIVRGVFVADTLSLPVRRQPAGYPGFISGEAGVATQFSMAENYGSIGLLAHNDLAGSEFFGLEEGQVVYMVYGDSDVRKFVVSEIHRYRAGQPNSPYSDFYDLDNGEEQYSAKEVFHMMYNREGDVIFQTCIAGEGISTWGRLFVVASPA